MARKKKNKETFNEEKIRKALIKKAIGFNHNEVVEEYACHDDGEIVLLKRKVTKKYVPPDIPAVKILLCEFDKSSNLENMTEKELQEEKNRLINELLDEEEKES